MVRAKHAMFCSVVTENLLLASSTMRERLLGWAVVFLLDQSILVSHQALSVQSLLLWPSCRQEVHATSTGVTRQAHDDVGVIQMRAA
jgi:hypothetical protein